MPYATQWLTPPGGRPSGSNISSARLLVPAGRFDHDSSGEIFSPTQFGFDLLLPAILVCSRSPSLNDFDVIVNTPCACALWAPHPIASATAPATNATRFSNIRFPPLSSRNDFDPFGVGSVAARIARVQSGYEHRAGLGSTAAGLGVAFEHLRLQRRPDLALEL